MFSRYFTDSHSIKTLPSYLLSSFIFISVIFLLFHISGFERVFAVSYTHLTLPTILLV